MATLHDIDESSPTGVDGEMMELFGLLDKDNSGTITTKEFAKAIHTFTGLLCPEQIEATVAKIDVDGDGEISVQEFAQMMGECSITTISKAEAKKYYESFDLDGSGYITVAELRHVMTSLGHDLDDDAMDAVFGELDEDGSGQCSLEEFEKLLARLDFRIVDDPEAACDIACPPPPAAARTCEKAVKPDGPEVQALLSKLKEADGSVCEARLARALELLAAEETMKAHPENPRLNSGLHWDPHRELRGIGEVLYKANHIAIIVADVGRSATFYADVVGLQPIRRPDFDRHGAWFTAGNIELHLIKGDPVVYEGDDLVVGHISLETHDIDRVPEILRAKGVPFRQNVSVPKGVTAGGGTNDSAQSQAIVKQYFFRDPDGYYLEVCNCDVLTQYCLGNKEQLLGYGEGVAPISVRDASRLQLIGLRLSKRARCRWLQVQQLMEQGNLKGAPHAAIAEALGCAPADAYDQAKLDALLVRRTVYGDVVQNETEESLKLILKLAGNDMAAVQDVMVIHAGDEVHMAPPAFFQGEGEKKVMPRGTLLHKKSSHSFND